MAALVKVSQGKTAGMGVAFDAWFSEPAGRRGTTALSPALTFERDGQLPHRKFYR